MTEYVRDKSYEARDIHRLLNIDGNRLFYWWKTLRLVTPEIEKGRGRGSRSRFSFNNLLELALIKTLLEFGFELNSVTEIMHELEKDKSGFRRTIEAVGNQEFKSSFCLMRIRKVAGEYEINYDDSFSQNISATCEESHGPLAEPEEWDYKNNAWLTLNITKLIEELINAIGKV